jgi:outer membrane receptor for ferrienterochelin and colicin
VHRFLATATRLVLLAFIALVALPLAAQTTGGIQGRVTDDQGASLPGVSVEAKSVSLQGARVAVTSADGRFRLELLPPGDYTVSFALSGFSKQTQTAVAVALGKETTLNAAMKIAVSAEVTVTGEAPVVDTTTTSVGSNLDTRTVETLPTGRNYSSVVQVVPGVSTDASNNNTDQTTITVYGSSGAENSFYIDGVNTTGAEYGFQGKELNYEFIQAVDVKTGGYEAEFGRATGGIINVITKSGGNEFHGDVFGYYDNDSLQKSADPVVNTGGTTAGFTKKDFGLDLGGFFIKDKLWFFGAYDKVKNTQKSTLPSGPNAGQVVESSSDRDLASAKLTFKITSSQSVIGTFFQDPRDDDGAIVDGDHTLNGDPATYLGTRSFGGKDFALRYEGLFGASAIVNAQISRHKEKNSIGPASSSADVIEYRDEANDFFQTGGFGLIQDKSFKRDAFLINGTYLLSQHEIKLGFEYEKEDADVVKRMSGGQRVDTSVDPVDPSKTIYRHFYWTTPDATIDNAPVSALLSSPQHKVTTLFLQDRFTPLPNLTINAGVRWDRQQIYDASGAKQIDLKHDFAPRFGFIFDPTNDHKTKIFGSYGRYYEQIPMDLVIRSFSYERQPRIFNFSPTDTHPDAQAEADIGGSSAILGGFTEPSDPNLHNQYLHEYILGAEREVIPNVALGLKGIYRSYGEVIEDFLCADDGTYCIGNPGKGIMQNVFTLDYSTQLPAQKPVRIYKGVQLDVTKRYSNGWYAQASYIYSRLQGNFDGEFAPFTNVGADPNISAAYDYYDFFTNGKDHPGSLPPLTKTNDGLLSNDRKHQLKVNGIWTAPFGLSVGLSAYYISGTPVTRYGYSDAYGRYEFFLLPRGSEGRTPDLYEADLHLGYPVAVGPVKINLLVDVFNLLNAQRAVLLDERWGFQESDNDSPTPVNPGYLKPALRTPPTSVRFGLRISY